MSWRPCAYTPDNAGLARYVLPSTATQLRIRHSRRRSHRIRFRVAPS